MDDVNTGSSYYKRNSFSNTGLLGPKSNGGATRNVMRHSSIPEFNTQQHSLAAEQNRAMSQLRNVTEKKTIDIPIEDIAYFGKKDLEYSKSGI